MSDHALTLHEPGQVQSSPAVTFERAMHVYLSGRPSPHTQRNYAARLRRFLGWYQQQAPGPFVALLREYISALERAGLAPRSIQAHINTIKGMLRMAAALDETGALASALPQLSLAAPPAVKGELQGARLGERQRQALINAPGTLTHKGQRDTAILALLAVLGLRRSEVCHLNWGHLAELDGHKVIQNLRGKHGRVRTIKLPVPLWRRLRAYAEQAGLSTAPDAPVFVRVVNGDHVQHGRRLSPTGIAKIVQDYTGRLGLDGISPHDLRRTAARLSRDGGASIEQVQVMLGHANPQTTSAYIGETLNLDDHAVDYGRIIIP